MSRPHDHDAYGSLTLQLVPAGRAIVAAPADAPTSGFVTPSTLTPDERSAWLRRINAAEAAGDYLEIPYHGVVYRDVPNANDWRIEPGSLEQFVADANAAIASESEAGPSGRRDHNMRLEGSIGHVVSLELQTVEGVQEVVAEGVITEPEMQRRFIRGEANQFSVGLREGGSYCSVCGPEDGAATWRWYVFACDHWAGDTTPEGRVESYLTSVRLVEYSFVGEGAVPGTRILTPTQDEERKKMAERQEIEKLREELEASKAANAAAAEQIEAQHGQVFDAIFGAAFGTKVLEADRAVCRAYYDSQGVEALREYLAAKAPVAGVSRETIGESTPVPPTHRPELSATEKGLLLATQAKRLGMLKTTPTEERLLNTEFASKTWH